MSANKGYGYAVYKEAYMRLGSFKAVARELGVSPSTVSDCINHGRANDPAMQSAMDAIGTGMTPSVAWIKTKPTADAPGYSVMLRPAAEAPEVTADRIKAALADLDAIKPVAAPTYTDADLCTLYPISDLHVGMRAWAKEVGEDYDTDIATERLKSWIGQCVAASPAAHTAIVLDVGDLTHADDETALTPKSKHPLDTDTRHFRTLDMTIQALAVSIELALHKHKRVIVRILPGNHNVNSYMAVMFALAERFADNDRVSVQKVPGEFFVHEFGKVLLAAHHGDKAKADRLVHFLADQYAEMWGRTKHRFLWTGHLHHMKAQDIGGVAWEQLRAVTSRDAYAVSHAYTARAQLQAITYHRDKGEVSRVKVNA
jgi:DNA-binding transcriptional regulator YdaS (Cro superfamily)